jgi:hypothetical protein
MFWHWAMTNNSLLAQLNHSHYAAVYRAHPGLGGYALQTARPCRQ